MIPLVCVIVIGATIGGFFYWRETHPPRGDVDDYLIKQSENGEKIVGNEKARLMFKIPTGWIEEKIDELEGSMIIYSPETEFIKPRTFPLKTGCLIGVAAVYNKFYTRMDFEELKKEVSNIHYALGVKSENFEEITVQNYKALKNTFDTVEIGKGTVIYILYKNKLYDLSAYAAPENEKQCQQEFTEFVNNISIK